MNKSVSPDDKPVPPRPRKLTQEELEALARKMCENLADPEVARRVDEAETESEEALRRELEESQEKKRTDKDRGK